MKRSTGNRLIAGACGAVVALGVMAAPKADQAREEGREAVAQYDRQDLARFVNNCSNLVVGSTLTVTLSDVGVVCEYASGNRRVLKLGIHDGEEPDEDHAPCEVALSDVSQFKEVDEAAISNSCENPRVVLLGAAAVQAESIEEGTELMYTMAGVPLPE